MLWRSTVIAGYSVKATDGLIGTISDFLFDDSNWSLRWVVIDTGTWLPGRRVLLPPTSFGRPIPHLHQFPVDVTRQKVQDSPGIESDVPVSRQHEANIYEHYGWLPYWGPTYTGMVNPMPAGVQATPDFEVLHATRDPGDPHLRSVEEVTGYYVEATDGEIGHIEEFLIEDGTWVLRYAVIDTKNWLPGRKVVISPAWLTDADWYEQKLKVGLTRQQVEESPEYQPDNINREYEARLFSHLGHPPYWL